MITTLPSLDVTKAWVSQTLEHDRPLTCCRFSPCGKFLVAGGQHEHALRWNLKTGIKTALPAHGSWVDSAVFQAESKRLFTADYGGMICCWRYDDERPTPIWTRADAHAGWIRVLAAAPDGNVLSAGNDRVIRLWSAADGKPVREFTGHENYVFSLAVAPDGKTFVSGDLFGKANQWDLASGELVRTFDAGALNTRLETFLADVGGIRSLAFDDDGQLLACGGMTDAKSNAFCPGKPAVLVFDVPTGKLRQTLRPTHTSDGPIKGLTFLSDGTLAGHAEHLNGGSSLEFWNPDQPKSKHVIKRHSGYCLDVHPDGLRLAVATFKHTGRGGSPNGRHSTPEEYTSHNGEIAIFSLFEKPSDDTASEGSSAK
jgi:WD40 repeat protein